MKKTTFAISSALALFAVGAVAGSGVKGDGHGDRAAHHAKMVDRMFDHMDANGDGAIDADERAAAQAARFAASDADGDGKVTEAEMKEAAQRHAAERAEKMASRRFARLDVNGDGGVDQSEMAEARGARHERMMKRVDADGDGLVTREEAMAAKPMRGHGGRHGGHDGEKAD
ncbi:MAG: calcium-binding protein [Paracoccaceae bacterium]